MKAAVFHAPNQPLTIEEVAVEKPKSREVLLRTAFAGLCHSDLHFIEGLYPIPTPVVLGHESSAVVEAVGDGVTYVRPGDHVITCVSIFCGTCFAGLCHSDLHFIEGLYPIPTPVVLGHESSLRSSWRRAPRISIMRAASALFRSSSVCAVAISAAPLPRRKRGLPKTSSYRPAIASFGRVSSKNCRRRKDAWNSSFRSASR